MRVGEWLDILYRGFYYVSLPAAVIILVAVTIGFYGHWHNLDVCHNEMIIAATVNQMACDSGTDITLKLSEQRLDGEHWTLDDCYIEGLGGVYKDYQTGLIAAGVLGMILSYTLWGKKE